MRWVALGLGMPVILVILLGSWLQHYLPDDDGAH